MSKHKRHHHKEDTAQHDNGLNFNNIAEALKNINADKISSLMEKDTGDDKSDGEDENAERKEILNSFKTLLNADKTQVVRTLIELYAASRNNLKR